MVMSRHDYGALIVGGFVRGCRRIKIYSLYHKKRLREADIKRRLRNVQEWRDV